MSTFFWPKVSKKSQKSQKLIFLISTVGKLLGKVDLHLGIDLDLDLRKCYQVWQNVAKVAKKFLDVC